MFDIPSERRKDFKRTVVSEDTRRMNHTLNSEISSQEMNQKNEEKLNIEKTPESSNHIPHDSN